MLKLDPVRALMSGFYSQLHEHEEFETLSIDATVKVCLAIMGQATAVAIVKNANAAAIDETDHLRRSVTVRGRSGCVLALGLACDRFA